MTSSCSTWELRAKMSVFFAVFASVPDALAFVIVPEIAEREVAQLHEAVGHLGFADSLIVTDLEFSDSDDNADEPDNLLQAAE